MMRWMTGEKRLFCAHKHSADEGRRAVATLQHAWSASDDADSSMSLCDFAVDLSQKQTHQTGWHHYFFVSFSPLAAFTQSGIDWR